MIGEFDLIKKYFSACDQEAHVELGIGDDCALMRFKPQERVAITTDTMNEGVHFFKGTAPYLLGYKALLVNLSDLAAMGACPCAFTLSVNMPQADEGFLAQFSRGLFELAKQEHVALIGGNTSSGPLSVSITAFGILGENALLRSGAKPGDGIYVTGSLGLSALYVEAGYGRIKVDKSKLSELCYKSMHPECRCALAEDLAKLGLSHCALDISDGVTGDLGHILEQSGVGADLQLEKLPLASELDFAVSDPMQRIRLAASGGGDYELLFTVPCGKSAEFELFKQRSSVPITRIGTITDHGKLRILYNDKIFTPSMKSFEHF